VFVARGDSHDFEIEDLTEPSSGPVLPSAGRTGWPAPSTAQAWAIGLVVAALLVGGFVGYQLGVGQQAAPALTVTVTAAPSAAPAPTRAPDRLLVLQATNNRCSAQVGRTLQLGVEVRNTSDQPLILTAVRPVSLATGALTTTLSTRGPCGQLPAGDVNGFELDADETVWLRGTFDVRVPCPTYAPVAFDVTFTQSAQSTTIQIGAFNDLGGVPYSGCGVAS
jgi:hypothetical protein